MSRMRSPVRRRAFAVPLLATLAVLLTPGLATAAPTLPAANTVGTIVVTKHAESAEVTPTGQPQRVDSRLVSGVQFALAEVLTPTGGHYDLTRLAGWQAISGLSADDSLPLGPARYQTTNAQGVATFEQVPLGIYLLWEVSNGTATRVETPDGVLWVGVARPTLVTMPLLDPTSTPEAPNWLETVYLYPKNHSTLEQHNPEPTPSPQPTPGPGPGPTPGPGQPPQPPVFTSVVPFLPVTPGAVTQPLLTGPTPLLALTGADLQALVLAALLVVAGGSLTVTARRNHARSL